MQNKTLKRIIVLVMVMALVITSVNFVPKMETKAADAFENSIKSFPASYKPYLRTMHKKYPNWKFVPYKTNINFATAVAKEAANNNSLIENYFSKFLKSNAKGDYFPSTKRYVAKDGGTWVSSNKNAVAYFMDPRNFLNTNFVYMFESLSYDASTQTQAGVEAVLNGTFMYKTNICYLNTKGKYIKTTTKYSAQIIAAAKTSNVNAYYIASKIRQEIGGAKNSKYAGMGASGSISGSYGSYKGYYNFYNIGAFTGANPIASGLKWCKSGKSYSRPWNTPMKSINGGAKYIGDKYINCGQNTIYFERFNVNRSSKYGLYSHQYMTNVYGAAAESMLTANAYESMKIAGLTKKFIIPVFNNMPASNQSVTLGSATKYGKTSSSIMIRKGPGTGYKGLVTLPKGTYMTVYNGRISNSGYGVRLLKNPYWLYANVRYKGKLYKGYVSASYTTVTTTKYISKKVRTKLPVKVSGAGTIYYRSNNPAVCTVDDSGYVTGKKKGGTTVYAISATGAISAIKISVASSGVAVTPNYLSLYTTQTRKLKAKLLPSKKKNKIKKYKSSNRAVASVTKKGVVTAKKAGTAVITCIPKKGFRSSCTVNVTNITPNQTIASAKTANYNSVKLNWTGQNGLAGYYIYRKPQIGNAVLAKTVAGNVTSMVDTNLETGVKYTYYIVAFRKVDGKIHKSPSSKAVQATPLPGKSKIKKLKAKGKGATFNIKSVAGASGYHILRSTKKGSGYKRIATIKANSKLTFYDKKLKKGTKYYYSVTAYTTVKGTQYSGKYCKVKSFTRKK
ncbi:MAG: Ig-like domain-containing protein [Eubacterium sp.]|nr:Ig-like domain-containing protein [Eubacterium sp.]